MSTRRTADGPNEISSSSCHNVDEAKFVSRDITIECMHEDGSKDDDKSNLLRNDERVSHDGGVRVLLHIDWSAHNYKQVRKKFKNGESIFAAQTIQNAVYPRKVHVESYMRCTKNH